MSTHAAHFPMTIGVLALQGDFDSHRAMLESVAQQDSGVLRGDALRVIAVRDARALAECDALVIPGGESTVMSRLCDRYGLWEPLRARLDEGMGALGTCAGMILLARNIEGATRNFQQKTLGALDIDVARNAYGAQADSFESDVALQTIESRTVAPDTVAPQMQSAPGTDRQATAQQHPEAENPVNQRFEAASVSSAATSRDELPQEADSRSDGKMLRGVFIRAPRITRCGPDVEVLARHEGVPVVVRQGRVMAASFHPEIAGDARLHALWLRSQSD